MKHSELPPLSSSALTALHSSDLIPQTPRDLSRADWQRGIGAILISQLTDKIFAAGPVDYRDCDKYRSTVTHDSWLEETGIGLVWAKAHYVVEEVVSARLDLLEGYHQRIPSDIQRDIIKHTYYGSRGLKSVLHEAKDAQVHFPLNVGQLLAFKAGREGVSGYSADNLNEVADILQRHDFKQALNSSLVTANGVWKAMAQSGGLVMYENSRGKLIPDSPIAEAYQEAIVFNGDGFVIQDWFTRGLRNRLRIVNKAGNSDKGVGTSVLPSSGCPARHLTPTIGSDSQSQRQLEQLSELFDKPTEELLRPRAQSVVIDGLDFMANVLRDYHVQSGN